MPTLSSLVAPQFILMTTYDAANDDKVGTMATLWKSGIIMIPTLSSLVELQVVLITIWGATSDDKVGIVTTLISQGMPVPYHWVCPWSLYVVGQRDGQDPVPDSHSDSSSVHDGTARASSSCAVDWLYEDAGSPGLPWLVRAEGPGPGRASGWCPCPWGW